MQGSSPVNFHYKPNTLVAYSKALQQGQNYLSGPEPNDQVVLMCCLLFYMIENARGDFNTATRHALAGLAILKKFGSKPKSKVNLKNGPLDDISDALLGYFHTLDTRFSFGSNYTRPALKLVTEDERKGLTPIVPPKFYTMAEISAAEVKLANWAFTLLSSVIQEHKFDSMDAITPSIRFEIDGFAREAEKATHALDDFYRVQKSAKDTTWTDMSRILSHQIMYMSLFCCFSGALASATSSPPVIDLEELYEKTVVQMEELRDGLIFNEPNRRSFLCLRGVTSSLVIVAIESTNAELRRKSKEILRNWPIREGLIDGKKAADVIENMAAMEAAGVVLKPPIPGWHFWKSTVVVAQVVKLSVAVGSPQS